MTHSSSSSCQENGEFYAVHTQDTEMRILALAETLGFENAMNENIIALSMFEHPSTANPPLLQLQILCTTQESTKTYLHALRIAGYDAVMQIIPNENWVLKSQENLRPVHIAPFYIHTEAQKEAHKQTLPQHKNTHAITINASTAFGTAHHASTQLVLHAIADLYPQYTKQEQINVLDLGCGTAILAIACAKVLPHAYIWASDIEEDAIQIAHKNVKNNQCAHIRTYAALGFDHALTQEARPFDVILANILAPPLIELAPAMRRHAHQSTHIILAGFIEEQAPHIEHAYQQVGFQTVRRYGQDDESAKWCALTLQASPSLNVIVA